MFENFLNHQRAAPRRMTGLVALILLVLAVNVPPSAIGQEPNTRSEFWPEIDVYVQVKPKVRLFFLGTVSKSVEDGEFRNAQSYEAQFGANVDYIPNENVILRTGYRYGTAVGESADPYKEHRLLFEQTFRKLLPVDLIISDRNRQDFRWVNGAFSFRYRNRVTIEREITLFKGRSITPYVSGELFYDTRFDLWNRNRWAVGLQQSFRRSPLRKLGLPKGQIILDLYFMRQNDSRSDSPHVNAFGAALIFHF